MMRRGNRGDARWADEFAWISNVDTIVDLLPLEAVYAQPHDLPHVRVLRIMHVPTLGRYSFVDKGRVTHVEEHANTATIDVDARPAALYPSAF